MKFLRSIRGKLTLSFLSVFGIMLIIFCIVIYNLQSYQYETDMDLAMKILADAANDEIHDSGITPKVFDEVKETYIPFTNISDHYIEICDSAGNSILRSPQLNDLRLPDPEKISKEYFIYETFHPKHQEKLRDMNELRLLTYPIEYNSRTYIIKIGVPLSGLESILDKIIMMYLIAVPLTLLLSAFAGWALSKKVYQPVTQIINKAEIITADNLSLRLPVNKSDNELARLSETLNSMIERLERSFQSLKQFTSDASHELRTPLTILRGQTETSLEKERTAEVYENLLRDNLDEILRLQMIVDKLLMLNQIESGRIILDKKLIDINELVIDVISKINYLAAKRQIKINLKISDKDVYDISMFGDYGSLFNVIFNILENAIKYSEDNSEIKCTVYPIDNSIGISIEDSGIGIKEKDIENIFDRFYRADASRTRGSSISLGLGLSISNGIVESHNGKILVESSSGKGSIFRIILPKTNV